MARVRLDRQEAEDGRLPKVCLVCGEPATVFRTKNMSWYPSWVIVIMILALLPGLIVAMILSKRLRLRGPFCPNHRNHWFGRSLTIGLTLVLVLVAGIDSLVVLGNQRGWGANVVGLACFGSLVVLGAWVILVIALQLTSVRPAEITDRDITLTGVSPRFIDVLEDFESDRYEDDRPRRRRRPPRDDSEDDERPRRRSPPPDAIEERD